MQVKHTSGNVATCENRVHAIFVFKVICSLELVFCKREEFRVLDYFCETGFDVERKGQMNVNNNKRGMACGGFFFRSPRKNRGVWRGRSLLIVFIVKRCSSLSG